MERKLVYVAGPLSKGGLAENCRHAHEAGVALLRAGLSAVVPHGSCFWGSNVEGGRFLPEALPAGVGHADWIEMDLEIVRRCDAVLRLPGESAGADAETAEAGRLGIPVFHGVDEVVRWARGSAE